MRILIGLIGLLAFSCKPKEEDSSEKSSVNLKAKRGFILTSQMTAPLSTNEYTKEEFEDELNSETDFYANEPDTPEDCIDRKFDSVRVSATSNTITVDTNLDLLECYRSGEDADPDATLVRIRIFMFAYCEKNDVSKYNNSGFNELSGNKKLCPNGGSHFINSSVDYNSKYEDDRGFKQPIKIQTLRTYSDASGHPCQNRLQGDKWVTSNCDSTTKTTLTYFPGTANETKTYDFTQLRIGKVTNVPWATYYDSGMIPFRVNNWTGSMTYSGSDSPPTWTATSGTDNANGTYAPDLSLSLNKKAHTLGDIIHQKIRAHLP